MSWNNAIPRANLPVSYEGSPLQSRRESNSPGHLWKRAQAASSRADAMTNFAMQVMRKINQAQRPIYAYSSFFPFKLYTFPGAMRQVRNSDDWRRLKVRFGYVVSDSGDSNIFIPDGTDLDPSDAGNYDPTNEVFLTSEVPPSTSASFIATGPGVGWHEFVVPDDGETYYFWVSLSLYQSGISSEARPTAILVGQNNTDAYSLQSGTSHLNDVWPSFPNNDPYHYLIGSASVSDGIITILQNQFGNISFNRFGAVGPVAPFTVASSALTTQSSFRGEYADNTLYFVGDMVTVKDANPTVGTFPTDIEVLYALLPDDPAGIYSPPYGPVSGLSPISNSPDPWKRLSSPPQVYWGTAADPNTLPGVAPFDFTKGALYYQTGSKVLWSWNTGSLVWTQIVP